MRERHVSDSQFVEDSDESETAVDGVTRFNADQTSDLIFFLSLEDICIKKLMPGLWAGCD